MAARRPERVASLVLVEAGGPRALDFFAGPAEAPHAAPADEALARLAAGEIDEALQAYIDAGQGEGAWDRSPAVFKALASDNADTLQGMAVDKSVPLSRETAARFNGPTLLIEGTASPPVFARINDVLEAVMPNAARLRFDGADHFLTSCVADPFNAAVLAFVATHECSF